MYRTNPMAAVTELQKMRTEFSVKKNPKTRIPKG